MWENLKVLNVNCECFFEMLSVELLFLLGYYMLIIGLYYFLSFYYDEGDFIDIIIDCCDIFLDMYLNGVVFCGGDLNRLDLDCFFILFGFVFMVNFVIRGIFILDNCFINYFELFNDFLCF